MSSMASTTSASSMKGFSVLQPGLGAPLSWMPAVGSKELAQLIDAYLPGPASAQTKRAAIATDFFKFAAETGESFKYYQVKLTQATPSPASSAFNTSPAMSNMSYASSSQPSTPAPGTASSSRASATKPAKTDYSHLPGMKILTTDGQDVTNTLSRGCKSKEQREHAHLMRVLKACDACKKKKIRCDPSHKRRTSSQASPKTSTKPTKKATKSVPVSTTQSTPAASTSAAFAPAPEMSFDFDMDFDMDLDMDLDMDFASFDGLSAMDMDSLFDFNQAADSFPQDFYGAVPAQNFDFYLGDSSMYSPAMTGSTASFNSPAQPLTPTGSGLLPQGNFTASSDANAQVFPQAGEQQPSLPYMTPGPHGSDYTDFNLYSPGSSFIDEEPIKLKASGSKRKNAARSAELPATEPLHTSGISSPGLHEVRASTGLAAEQQRHSDHVGYGTVNPQMLWSSISGGDQLQQQATTGHLVGGVVLREDHRPYHGDDVGHNSGVQAATTTRLRAEQQQVVSGHSPASPATLPEGRERHNDLPTGSLQPSIARVSSPVPVPSMSPRNTHQETLPLDGGALMHQRAVSPPNSHIEELQCQNSLPHTSIARHSPATVASPSTLSQIRRSEGRKPGRLLPGGLPVNEGPIVNSGVSANESLVVNGGRATHGGQWSNGLSSTCGLLATAGLHSLPSALGRLNNAAAAATASAAAAAAAAANRTMIVGTMSSSSSDMGMQVSCQQIRQALHSKRALAASSSPRRPLPGSQSEDVAAVDTVLPVRQTLSYATSTSTSTCSPSLAHLAVFGLVSMLLIVGFTSLLQQLQYASSPLFDHLPTSSVPSSLVILSLLSTLSPLDTAKSIHVGKSSPTRQRRLHQGWAAIAGRPCAPVSCY